MTPIGSRLSIALDDEYLRMQNEWFFKWHFIGGQRSVEIDSFRGRPIQYGGIKFSGTARQVYWQTIQHYLRKKVGSIFDNLEHELTRYPPDIRTQALSEAHLLISGFVARIRKAAIEKDRVLRGNGTTFPPEHDAGNWRGSQTVDIEARIAGLRQIYCSLERVAENAKVTEPPPRPEIITLKPSIWGLSVDVKEVWRRLRKWYANRAA